ncbi:hypothetical protein [Sphingomonas sp. AX6]|uniref:hypothetical protein n=1 Tax=Sphingomonas sp. AX6 TaxID=2653171 RepID=UPI0012EFDB8F|nr:hypothetical protein [Sphingomonas sp. AX6]VXD00981.1 conserved membrane hypothetical protein [Sphingomonas sp. AX6]
MSFREKTHWIAFVAIVLAFGWYFLNYPWSATPTAAGLWASGGMLIAVSVGIILAMSVATAVIAVRNRKEVDLREDERDRAIHRYGTHLAYYPMIIGSWTCIGLIFAGIDSAILLNVILAMVVGAELVRIGSQIWLYRQG